MFGRLTILLKFSETVLSPDCMWVRTRDGLIHGLQYVGSSVEVGVGLKFVLKYVVDLNQVMWSWTQAKWGGAVLDAS